MSTYNDLLQYRTDQDAGLILSMLTRGNLAASTWQKRRESATEFSQSAVAPPSGPPGTVAEKTERNDKLRASRQCETEGNNRNLFGSIGKFALKIYTAKDRLFNKVPQEEMVTVGGLEPPTRGL